jgi:hypothetical protein
MFKKIPLILLFTLFLIFNFGFVYSANTDVNESFLELREVDKGTFGEYQYQIARQYLDLRTEFERPD